MNSFDPLTLSNVINSNEASGRALKTKEFNMNTDDQVSSFTYPNFPPISRNEKHLKRYLTFIESRVRVLSESESVEQHHIIPRSLGGSNEPENIIRLTMREHYIAHMILWKAFGGPMAIAFFLMSIGNKKKYRIRLTAKQYQTLKMNRAQAVVTPEFRQKMSVIMTGAPRSEEHRRKISQTLKEGYASGRIKRQVGKTASEETRAKLSKAFTGRPLGPMTEDHKRKIAQSHIGIEHTDETKKRLSEIQKRHISFTKDGVNKIVDKDDPIIEELLANGWVRGLHCKRRRQKGEWRPSKESIEKVRNSLKGRKWMTKSGEDALVKIEEVDSYISFGWTFGRSKIRSRK